MGDYQNSDSDQLMKRLRPSAHPVDEVTYPSPLPQATWSMDDIPRTVACTVNQGATVTSMDFHPSHHTILLVGSGNGEITLWEIDLREGLVSKPFKIWDMAAHSIAFQTTIVKDSSISITKVTWSPDGSLIGIAFTKHLIHLYSYQAPNDLRNMLEIDAHVGRVNDIAFSHPNKQLCVVTCGDDKLIKVWDLNGRKLHTFEGHEAPVYSVCPHHKENIQRFAISIDFQV
uniref:Topless-related protein 2 n=1 Tax=Anthurium amnicola TaxID=1678845 RepID=A0A1D1XIF7_9ARAE